MEEPPLSRPDRIREAWAEGFSKVLIALGDHLGLVVTILLFGGLEWLRRKAVVLHLQGTSASIAHFMLLVLEGCTLARGVAPVAIETIGDIAEAAGHAWQKIRKAWR